MVKVIGGLPQDVLGIEASGTVTREDYEKVIVPEVHRMLEKQDRIKLLYQADEGIKFTPRGDVG
jgi:hypothetical protein